MPRTSLLADLPEALPDRGVLLLQTRPGRNNQADSIRGAFLKHLTTVYLNRQSGLAQEDYYDRPWQILAQDSDLLRRVGNALQAIRDAGRHGAVVVHIIIQGPDNSAWRHQEVEQHLVELMTGRGAVVSVIAPTGPTEAQSTLYRPSPDGEPSVVLEKFDLRPYLVDYSSELQS